MFPHELITTYFPKSLENEVTNPATPPSHDQLPCRIGPALSAELVEMTVDVPVMVPGRHWRVKKNIEKQWKTLGAWFHDSWLACCGTLEVEELQKNCSHTCLNLRRSHHVNG